MFLKTIITTAFALIQKFLIDKIEYAPLKQYFLNQIEPAKKVAELLTDKDPNNNAQLADFWEQNKSDLLAANLDFAIMIVEDKVKDPLLRDIIVSLLQSIIDEQDNPA